MASADQLAAQIQASKGLCVSPAWVNNFLASNAQRNIPASALTKTAIFRILASDIRESLSPNPTSVFPANIFDPNIRERHLQGPIPVQVLDIEDIGASLWSQVEAIERVERGEAIRGREIVRTISVGEDQEAADNNSTANYTTGALNTPGSGGGPHRLVLQDANGQRAVAVEMHNIEGLSIEKLSIGAKLVLRNALVARGMILLHPACATLLGGKIEALDRPWKEGRKARILERISAVGAEAS
ncbi:hypothetical protein N7468_009533 [Penicillium chermesinum]|uniref:RecQ-mediated genome instability protein 1 n=1 Tax=Penicillium chermesinum TaxID=63820 RepID=A0A9W9NKE6_9EURO|nr:uncharacterized protein N7468_009533 [Penicillium chermesinum]KAJ5220329.1 hypothetical protein N7468_009533 [Penicillium chermesinum]KAJ6157772.1 hypothetical protein N7470_005364 [Penicillium chermesinum]